MEESASVRMRLRLPIGMIRGLAGAALVAALGGSAVAADVARIVSPKPGEIIHSNVGRVPVAVAGAEGGVRFQAVIDGKPVGRPASSPLFAIEGVDRGIHHLAVVLPAPSGSEIGRTEAIEFHVWQASRLFPGRRG